MTDIVCLFYQEPKRSKIPCPFHGEKTPSCHIYPDGFYCFGCGAAGDGVDFIAKLQDLQPIDATRLIANRFNLPVDRKPTPEEQQRAEKLARRRYLTKKYKEIETAAFKNMADFRSLTLRTLEVYGLDGLPTEAAQAAHQLPQVEHYMQILISGNPPERLELLRRGVLSKWAKLSTNI